MKKHSKINNNSKCTLPVCDGPFISLYSYPLSLAALAKACIKVLLYWALETVRGPFLLCKCGAEMK